MGNVLKTLLITANECDYLEENALSKIGRHISFIQESGIRNIIFHINISDEISDEKKNLLIHFLTAEIEKTFEKATVINHYAVSAKPDQLNDFSVYFVLGLGGREELKTILSELVQRSKNGLIDIENMTPEGAQEFISENLFLPMEPDLVLSCHEETLTDFMIWQTIYSEYVFVQKSLGELTAADLDKAFSDFKARQRRYGV
ncbi:undecaprenyl diphosphate synthase family protein [Methanolapillus millepedarum]|uniref:Ditrans,polycis-undecaprenyl-diphosphate synthase ((2E,6E)-farnesyl-diphosphate specific) n=1 Tax=Methanolapillus millepedarum TaxID=3028296 RepID=A0AA96ZUJ9_9EURY|nr:Ditrans,polycis-undecaprenyl-diphosphate synthase ((2E,6E)-farnesyl-diphosphate specific) [Methanosarcinaceae archaeon Ac7]